jgi:pyruvate/2-oxoglutarate dehydrogenase complex dihydrolipoamide dehydrogenase (E3) component
MKQYDAIVIGAGQAGPPLAGRLASEGLSTAVIERKDIGGTCVNVGCIPTKTLVASARVAHFARRAADFGVTVGKVGVDMKAVKARMDRIRAESKRNLTEWLEGMDKVDVIRGHARFSGPKQIEVNGDVLNAKRVFINCGARARVPDMPGLDEVEYLTNSSMLELDAAPPHLLIVGGSYIGLEFAQMFRRFGSEVTVIEMADRLISRDDRDTSAAVQEILEGEGVRFELGAECIAVKKDGKRIQVTSDCADEKRTSSGTHLLLAIGRVPNTADLGLDAAGVDTDAQGFITVDEELRTNVKGIWALGEVNRRGAFTHTSYNDFEIVAANLFSKDKRRVTDRVECYALYTDPPMGRAGMTEQAARDAGYELLVGKRAMTRVGRAREFGETLGFMKVIVDAKTDRILGAAILGLSGDEAIHCIVDVMGANLPYSAIQRAVHIHPTVSELIPTVLGDLRGAG